MKASEGNNIRVGQSEAEQCVSCLHHPGKINTAYRAVMRSSLWTVYSPSREIVCEQWTQKSCRIIVNTSIFFVLQSLNWTFIVLLTSVIYKITFSPPVASVIAFT